MISTFSTYLLFHMHVVTYALFCYGESGSPTSQRSFQLYRAEKKRKLGVHILLFTDLDTQIDIN